MDKDSKLLQEAYSKLPKQGPPKITNPVWSYDAYTGRYTADMSELSRNNDENITDPWGRRILERDAIAKQNSEGETTVWLVTTNFNGNNYKLVIYND